jgi:hypothetical protein
MSTNNGTQTANSLSDALSQSAPLRAQAVQYLGQGQQAESSALAIEQSRIASRYGTNSAESQEIAARVAANTARGNTVALETQRSQATVPQSTPDGFIVYGFVVDSTGAARKGVDIAAVSTAYASLATAKTDSQGAFLICVPTTPSADAQGASGTRQSKESKSREAKEARDAKEGQSKEPTGAGPTASTPLTFQLVLSAKAKTPTFRNPEVFQAIGGQTAYREIVTPANPTRTGTKSS